MALNRGSNVAGLTGSNKAPKNAEFDTLYYYLSIHLHRPRDKKEAKLYNVLQKFLKEYLILEIPDELRRSICYKLQDLEDWELQAWVNIFDFLGFRGRRFIKKDTKASFLLTKLNQRLLGYIINGCTPNMNEYTQSEIDRMLSTIAYAKEQMWMNIVDLMRCTQARPKRKRGSNYLHNILGIKLEKYLSEDRQKDLKPELKNEIREILVIFQLVQEQMWDNICDLIEYYEVIPICYKSKGLRRVLINKLHNYRSKGTKKIFRLKSKYVWILY